MFITVTLDMFKDELSKNGFTKVYSDEGLKALYYRLNQLELVSGERELDVEAISEKYFECETLNDVCDAFVVHFEESLKNLATISELGNGNYLVEKKEESGDYLW